MGLGESGDAAGNHVNGTHVMLNIAGCCWFQMIYSQFQPEMSNPFFEHPILNSPYAYPPRHWELDKDGQPTQKIIETRRRADFITPIPKPRKRKTPAQQEEIVFDEGKALSTKQQQYDLTSIINEVRQHVDQYPLRKAS